MDLIKELIPRLKPYVIGWIREYGGNITKTVVTQSGLSAVMDVRTYGATGDGTTDAAAKIQRAIDDAYTAGGGTLWLPRGTYILEQALVIRSNVTLMGEGGNASILKLKAGATYSAIVTAQNSIEYFVHLYNFAIDGNKADASGGLHGLDIYVDHSIIEGVYIRNVKRRGINLCDPERNSSTPACFLNKVVDCHIEDPEWEGVWQWWTCTDSWIARNNIGSWGFNIRGAGGPVRIIDNHLDGYPLGNIYWEGSGLVINNNIIENANQNGIVLKTNSWDTDVVKMHSLISNNLIRGASQSAENSYSYIDIRGANDTDAPVRGIVISGNVFDSPTGVLPRYGVSLMNVDSVAITGNSFHAAVYGTNPHVYQLSGCTNVKITGNVP